MKRNIQLLSDTAQQSKYVLEAVSTPRRKIIHGIWATPIVAAVSIPSHAQTSTKAGSNLSLDNQSVSLNVGQTDNLAAAIKQGIKGGKGPYELAFEDPQNPGSFLTSGLLDFGDWTYNIDTDTITGVMVQSGVINVQITDATGATATAEVAVDVYNCSAQGISQKPSAWRPNGEFTIGMNTYPITGGKSMSVLADLPLIEAELNSLQSVFIFSVREDAQTFFTGWSAEYQGNDPITTYNYQDANNDIDLDYGCVTN